MKRLLVKIYRMLKGLFYDGIFWITSAIVIAVIAGITGVFMKYYGYRICAMDFFPYVSKFQGFALLPVTVCVIMAALRYEFLGGRVVKFRKLSYVWMQIFFKTMLLSLICAVLYTLVLCLCGKLYPVFLWDRRDSMMFLYTAHVMPEYSYWRVIGEFLWVSFLNIWLFGEAAVLIFWISGHPLAGILISVTSAAVLNQFPLDFYKKMRFSHEEICWNIAPLWRISVFLPLLLLIFFMGLILVRKRDFLKSEK